MSSTTDKEINGVIYERDYLARNCGNCAAMAEPSSVCATLVQDDCSTSYTFKIKDITKQHQPAPPLQPAVKAAEGVKYDHGKTLYSLVPPYALEAVAKNLTAGLKKYKEIDNWKKVPDAENRYLNALYRHLEQHRKGEIYDKDNADPSTTHLSAIAVNAMFLLELMLNPELNKEKTND